MLVKLPMVLSWHLVPSSPWELPQPPCSLLWHHPSCRAHQACKWQSWDVVAAHMDDGRVGMKLGDGNGQHTPLWQGELSVTPPHKPWLVSCPPSVPSVLCTTFCPSTCHSLVGTICLYRPLDHELHKGWHSVLCSPPYHLCHVGQLSYHTYHLI